MEYFIGDTKEKIFWQETINSFIPQGIEAKKKWLNLKPYFPNEVNSWQKEIAKVELFVTVLKNNESLSQDFLRVFKHLDDERTTPLFLREANSINFDEGLLTGFTIKNFLWASWQLTLLLNEILLSNLGLKKQITDWEEILKLPWFDWLKAWQPKANYLTPHFALSDLDDDTLLSLRLKRDKVRKELKGKEEEKKNELNVAIKVEENNNRIEVLPEEIEKLKKELTELTLAIAKGEEEIIQKLIKEQAVNFTVWQRAKELWVDIEVTYYKAKVALAWKCTKPLLREESSIFNVENGRHPYFQELWQEKKKEFVPLTFAVFAGVNIFFGANMSGKSIALKTIGFIQALAQHAFFVPASKFSFSLVDRVSLIAGEQEDVKVGDSSFQGEIKRLIHDLSLTGKGLYLYDELINTTNPLEGEALNIALIRYLQAKQGEITIITSHYPNLIKEKGVNLYLVEEGQIEKVVKGSYPYRAIKIAEELGLPQEIINIARDYWRSKVGEENGNA